MKKINDDTSKKETILKEEQERVDFMIEHFDDEEPIVPRLGRFSLGNV